ncbi:unnamed protein product [Ilex paraguariensis]|uniref:Uncharacterized protein n=1 Tax=Ilex paraguariensis TaxID=185542 RepID=A0ABC8QP97_9AQUA
MRVFRKKNGRVVADEKRRKGGHELKRDEKKAVVARKSRGFSFGVPALGAAVVVVQKTSSPFSDCMLCCGCRSCWLLSRRGAGKPKAVNHRFVRNTLANGVTLVEIMINRSPCSRARHLHLQRPICPPSSLS